MDYKYLNIDTNDVLFKIVDSMRERGLILSVSDCSTNKWIVTFNGTFPLDSEWVLIENKSYQVEIKSGVTYLKGETKPNIAAWKAEAPYFYCGTPLAVDDERKVDYHANSNEMKYPFICFFEPFKSHANIDIFNPIDKILSVWAVFMDKTTTNKRATIAEMQNLFNSFIDAGYKSKSILIDDTDTKNNTYDLTEWQDWGLYMKKKGAEKMLFQEELTGIEIENFKINLIKKDS